VRHEERGFTLIELLIVVVIIGILAAIAIPKFANTKEKATLASMKSDLRNLVTQQEGFFYDNNDYAGTIGALQVNQTGGKGVVAFSPSQGNALTLNYAGATGWSATATNAVIKGSIQTCGIYVGSGVNPNPAAVKQEGAPACY
jgi:prepilin-type N-terminal cleavage/methylation domain-containing protein